MHFLTKLQLNDFSLQRCPQWIVHVLERYHWLIACWFICSVNYLNSVALSAMDRKLLTASPFPEMEHQLPTELIFPSVVHPLKWTHLMFFLIIGLKRFQNKINLKRQTQDFLWSLLLFCVFMVCLGIIKITLT